MDSTFRMDGSVVLLHICLNDVGRYDLLSNDRAQPGILRKFLCVLVCGNLIFRILNILQMLIMV
jgi:hypothetical protein